MISIIPAIDIINGQCVRLTQGNYTQQKIYSKNPVEVAKSFEDAGLKQVHLVDLDGAKTQHIVNTKVLEAIANQTNLKIDFGGGLKTEHDVQMAFELGASQITAGSIAVLDPDLVYSWMDLYGPEKIILGADSKAGKIAIHGWQEASTVELFAFLKNYIEKGIQYCICTDIAKDGLLEGPSWNLYEQIVKEFPSLKLIASGGVSSIKDLERLEELGCYGAIVGKAIYEETISLKELEKWMVSC